jgi:hypothetical protein
MPPLQRMSQVPQLNRSVRRFVSHPSLADPLQSSQPASQAPMTQLPVAQDSPACEMSQTAPHIPQLPSDVSEVSQPSEAMPLQLFHPGLQVKPHVPLEQ